MNKLNKEERVQASLNFESFKTGETFLIQSDEGYSFIGMKVYMFLGEDCSNYGILDIFGTGCVYTNLKNFEIVRTINLVAEEVRGDVWWMELKYGNQLINI